MGVGLRVADVTDTSADALLLPPRVGGCCGSRAIGDDGAGGKGCVGEGCVGEQRGGGE